MNAKQLRRWRNELLTRLEDLSIDARRTRQMMLAQGLDELEDKTDFESKWERICEMFPDDFHPMRAGDLGRHVHFAQPHDFDDIENSDIPAVMASVGRYGRSGDEFIAEELDRVSIDSAVTDLLHPQIRDACAELIANRQFGEAAQRAVSLLMDEIRRLSGVDSDGDALLRNVIRTTDGSLAFSDCQTAGARNVTEGLKMISQGLYKGVRNPVAHGWDQLRSTDVLQIMATCSLLLTNLQFAGAEGD